MVMFVLVYKNWFLKFRDFEVLIYNKMCVLEFFVGWNLTYMPNQCVKVKDIVLLYYSDLNIL